MTLSGSVENEVLRDKAEQLVANTAGVKKVVDELTIGVSTPATTGVSQPPEETADQVEQGNGVPPQQPDDATVSGAPQPPPYPQTPPVPVAPPGAPAPVERSPGQPGSPSYSQQFPGPQPAPQQPYRVQQQPGQSVTIPTGTMLRVRLNQAMDSRHTQPGAPFDGVVLNDVLSNGMVAIPRGALVQGYVADAQPGEICGAAAGSRFNCLRSRWRDILILLQPKPGPTRAMTRPVRPPEQRLGWEL